MRILIGTDTYPPTVNGAAQFTRRLAHGLAARGHQIHLACPSPTGAPGRMIDEAGVVVHRFRSFRYAGYQDFPVALPAGLRATAGQLLDDAGPDAVHVQSGFFLGRALLVEARRRGIGIVATNHLMPANVLDHLPCPQALRPAMATALWRDLRRVYLQADAVTSPTRRAVDLMYANTGIDGLAVSNGIDLDRYRRIPRVMSGGPVVLFVGRLDPEKHLEDAITAMALLPDDVPGRLEIVGAGSARAGWERLAGDLDLDPDRVRFLGKLPDDELLEAYGRASVFAMPGTAELQSLVTLEAMATGMPVVAADAMALPHLVHDGENGFLYRPGDATALAGRLATLLGDAGLRHRMAEEGRRIVAPHGIEHTLDTFEGLYRQVRRLTPLSSRTTGRQPAGRVADRQASDRPSRPAAMAELIAMPPAVSAR
ncbi:glycosyltransferase [Acidipropionibacterium virtanenii]|uniref:N-acetyl-alpha-D-glucosaminyl L-malate synthase n=1 Tax=Acidipropionibacterium virtanenii TaxID=2057246 RepID=A0A344UY86_9ACTN|nr:glycosyltransferase [Acidipropionibacterium virtanenii]AXE40234.1 N-acetyl-alpha-D-glucosaminyl L-malate synthase [Acidipropionibacterium virtanenii]